MLRVINNESLNKDVFKWRGREEVDKKEE